MRVLAVAIALVPLVSFAQLSLDESYADDGWLVLDLAPFERIEQLAADDSDGLFALGYRGEFGENGYDQTGLLLQLDASGALNSFFGSGGVVEFDHPQLSYFEPVSLMYGGEGITTLSRVYDPATSDDQPFALTRHTASGGLDLNFGTEGWVELRFLGWQNDPQWLAETTAGLVVCGASFDTNYVHKEVPVLARLLADGSPDPAFGGGQLAFDVIAKETVGVTGFAGLEVRHDFGGVFHHVLEFPDERLLCTGSFYGPLGYDVMATCLLPSGAVDTTFADGGLFTLDFDPGSHDWVESAALLPNGNITLAVHTEGWAERNAYTLTLTPDGELVGQSEWAHLHEDLMQLSTGPNGQIWATGRMVEPANDLTLNSADYWFVEALSSDGSEAEETWTSEALNVPAGLSHSVLATASGVYLAGYLQSDDANQFANLAVLRLAEVVPVVEEAFSGTSLVFPNPCSAGFWWKGETEAVLNDAMGRSVLKVVPGWNACDDLSLGTYFLWSDHGAQPLLVRH